MPMTNERRYELDYDRAQVAYVDAIRMAGTGLATAQAVANSIYQAAAERAASAYAASMDAALIASGDVIGPEQADKR